RQRDHLPHIVRQAARQLAGIDAPEAPADETHGPAVAATQLAEPGDEAGDGLGVRPEVAAQAPGVRVIAALAQEGTERARRAIAGEVARDDEHGVAVAARRARQERQGGQEHGELGPGASLEGEQQHRRRCDLPVPSHDVATSSTARGAARGDGMPVARANGIEIAYEVIGRPQDRPLLLVMGLGSQMIPWDDELCGMLAARGHRVIRFDNRDIGLSSKMVDRKAPNVMAAFAARARGAAIDAPYTLSDMARDTAGLLDALGIEAAHVV